MFGEWEADPRKFGQSTKDFAKFQAYIQKTSALTSRLTPSIMYMFRRLHPRSYERQITDARLQTRFNKHFGSHDNSHIANCNFRQRKHQIIKSKGFQMLFRKAGYDTYLAKEFYKS